MRIGLLADLHWRAASGAAGQQSAGWHAPYDFARLAERCAATVATLAARGCELLVVAGDLTDEGDAASCAAALDCLLAASPIPVAVVAGNHDVGRDNELVPSRAAVREAWRRAAAVAEDQLVALRAVGVDGDGRGTRDGGERAAHSLATVVVSHYPLVAHAERLAAAGLPFPGELADRAAQLERIEAPRVPTVVLSGHLHVRDAFAHGNVLQICVPALVEPPHEAAIVELDPFGEAVRCIRVGSGGDAAEHAREPWLLAPADEQWEFASGSWSRREVAVPAEVLMEVAR